MQFNANKTLSSGKRMGKKFIKGGRSALSEVAIVQLLRGHPEHWLSTADILEGLSRPAQWNTANPALVLERLRLIPLWERKVLLNRKLDRDMFWAIGDDAAAGLILSNAVDQACREAGRQADKHAPGSPPAPKQHANDCDYKDREGLTAELCGCRAPRPWKERRT